MNHPKVLVGCPTYEGFGYCLEIFLERIRSLSYPNYDILLVDNSEGDDYLNRIKEKRVRVIKAPRFKEMFETVAYSRNMMIDFALDNGFDYLLNLDQDVIPPKNIIEELIGCDKDIISGLYFGLYKTSTGLKKLPVAYANITEEEFNKMQKISPFPPFVKSCDDIKRNLTDDEIEGERILEVRVPSNGCMLIKRNVMEDKDIRFGMIDLAGRPGKTGDEMLFCKKAREKGFRLYVYTKIKCEHLVKKD